MNRAEPEHSALAMDDDWREHAKSWDQDEHARHFAEEAMASLLEHLNLNDEGWEERRVLDFGCGTGLLTEKLAPLVGEVVALDLSPAMLDVLRKKELDNVAVHCADIGDDAVRAAASWLGNFDLIVASSVCGLLPSYNATLLKLAQELSPGGHFVQWDWLLSADDEDDDDGLRLRDVAMAFNEARLTCVKIKTAFDMDFDGESVPVVIGVARKGA